MNKWGVAGAEFIHVGVALVVIVALISVVAGLVREYIPQDKVRKRLSKNSRWGSFIGAGLGMLTPFCSASMVPVAMGMIEMGIPFGTVLSFLLSAPVTNFVVVGVIWAVFGWKITLFYFLFTYFGAVIGGMIFGNTRLKNDLKQINYKRVNACSTSNQPVAAASNCGARQQVAIKCGSSPSISVEQSACATAVLDEPVSACGAQPVKQSCCSGSATDDAQETSQNKPSHKIRITNGMYFAKALFLNLLPYILLGALISSLTAAFVPQTIVEKYVGNRNILAIPLSAAIGVPLYLRIEMAIPLLKVLIAKGMGMGAAMALLIGGTGASLPEIAILLSMLKPRAVTFYVLTVFTIATISGFFFHIFF